MTPCDLLRRTAARFRSAGVPDPETDSALLLASLTGGAPLSLRLDTDTVLPPSLLARFESLVRQRLERIPLQYLVGEAPFCGRLFAVDARVLIPRPETELLCYRALELLEGVPHPRIMDLCCGSGCVGLSLKAALPGAFVTLSDLSEDALAVSAENSRRLSLEVDLRHGDLLEGFAPSSFDLIVCNPPYIPSADCESLQPEVLFEPRMALDGGADGLSFYRRITREAPAHLAEGGMLLAEIGAEQGEAVRELFAENGFSGIRVIRDLAGRDRVGTGIRPQDGRI